MNRPTKNKTKAIGYSCCYASEGSDVCGGAAVAKAGGLTGSKAKDTGLPTFKTN